MSAENPRIKTIDELRGEQTGYASDSLEAQVLARVFSMADGVRASVGSAAPFLQRGPVARIPQRAITREEPALQGQGFLEVNGAVGRVLGVHDLAQVPFGDRALFAFGIEGAAGQGDRFLRAVSKLSRVEALLALDGADVLGPLRRFGNPALSRDDAVPTHVVWNQVQPDGPVHAAYFDVPQGWSQMSLLEIPELAWRSPRLQTLFSTLDQPHY